MNKVYRAIIRATGEILECDVMPGAFKRLYGFALRHGKDAVSADCSVVLIELEEATYSDDEYINSYGYLQRDMVDRKHIAFMVFTKSGYAVDSIYGCFELDYEEVI